MKRFNVLTLLIAVLLILSVSLTACQSNTSAPTEAATEKATEAATEKPTEAATEKATEAATTKPTEAPKSVNEDEMGVKITKTEVIEDYYKSSPLSMGADDAIVFTMENSSNSAVSSITIYFLAYDADGNTVEPGTGVAKIDSGSDIVALSTSDDFTLSANSSEEIAYKCDAEKVSKVDTIVESYVSGGVKYENNAVEEWVKSTYSSKEV